MRGSDDVDSSRKMIREGPDNSMLAKRKEVGLASRYESTGWSICGSSVIFMAFSDAWRLCDRAHERKTRDERARFKSHCFLTSIVSQLAKLCPVDRNSMVAGLC